MRVQIAVRNETPCHCCDEIWTVALRLKVVNKEADERIHNAGDDFKILYNKQLELRQYDI